MPKPGQKWIVGLDLRPRSQGAMNYAAWLAERAGEDSPERLVGVHVIEDDHMQAALRYHHYDEVMKAAREATDMCLHKAGLTDAFDEVHVVQGKSAEASLEAARTYHHADGVIIGRYAKSDSIALRRLGRVARRVLRKLGSPVVVVPPDWEKPASDPPGPVVASCNLRRDSVHGMRVAADTANRLGVPLRLVHVVPMPHDYGAHYLPVESLEKLREDHEREGREGLAQFAKDLGMPNCQQEVRQGSVVEALVDEAKQQGATLLVSGSRRLSSFERLLLTSIGSELAATAPCPVMVVPPSAADHDSEYVLESA
jgi:nucleotide-binding universal stress UspA family protein